MKTRTNQRVPGMLVAGATALVSGVSVFVNSYGVHSFSSPALYTTAKNMAAVVFWPWPPPRRVGAPR